MRGRSVVVLGFAVCLLAFALPARAQEEVDDAFVRRVKAKMDAASAPLMDEIQRVLKTAVTVPPAPSIPVECFEGELGQHPAVKAYVNQAREPEYSLITRLLAIKRTGQLVGLENESLTLERQLVQRLQTKAESLLKPNRGYPRKVMPVAGFGMEVVRMFQLLGDTSGASQEQAFMVKLGEFIAAALNEIKTDLLTKHDFRSAKALIRIARWAENLGSTNPAVANAYETVQAAMTFKLTLTFEPKLTGANGLVEEWTLTSEFDVRSRFDDKLEKDVLAGSGTGKYVSYSDSDPSPTSRLTMTTAAPFEVNARIDDFDACAGTATVSIDQFFAQMETYTSANSDEPSEVPSVMVGWQVLFNDLHKGWYDFKVPVVNLKESPIDTIISKQLNAFAGKLTIELQHTPKGGT